MAQLGELVAWFESDEFTLEDAIDKFREAEKLGVARPDDAQHPLRLGEVDAPVEKGAPRELAVLPVRGHDFHLPGSNI